MGFKPTTRPEITTPLKGIGTTAEDRTVVYESPELDGLIEPHVLAQFQNITFKAVFDLEHTQHICM